MWRLIAVILVLFGVVGIVHSFDYELDATTDFNKVIFTINGDGTISMILYGDYQGDDRGETVHWLIPVPSEPLVEILADPITETLFDITDPILTLPPHYCSMLSWTGGDMHRWETGSGAMTPIKTTFIDGISLRYVIDALQADGYHIGTHELVLLHEYLQQGMSFLLLTVNITRGVSPASPTSRFSPAIKITYQAENPVLPLLLTSTSITQRAIWVWIFGNTRYTPQNYSHPTIDYATFRTTPSPYANDESLSITYEFLHRRSNSQQTRLDLHSYHYTMNQLQDQYDGVFVTEFASSTEALIGEFDAQSEPLITNLINKFPYVTRLRGQFDPEQILYDELFVPAPDLPDVARYIDLNNYVDPLHFWGCSSRELVRPQTELLLDSVMVNGTYISYPKGWIQHNFIGNHHLPLTVFSPQAITLADVRAFFDGVPTPPMFVHMPSDIIKKLVRQHPDSVSYDRYAFRNAYFRQALGDDIDMDAYRDTLYMDVSWSDSLYTDWFRADNIWRGMFVLLTSDFDYRANQTLYDAVRVAVHDYAFYSSPYLRHTLFFGTSGVIGSFGSMVNYATRSFAPAVYWGFPEGWVERMMPDDVVVIAPENAPITFQTPAIRLIPFENVKLIRPPKGYYMPYRTILYHLKNRYQLDDATMYRLKRDVLYDTQHGCSWYYNTYPYEANGYKGYISFANAGDVILEASAPIELFPQYDDILRWSADSFRALGGGCG
ncbi:MAG: DUF2330 domain-containing protein [bacterium]|nr:DUF2330 domain-containing protein [bacterium]